MRIFTPDMFVRCLQFAKYGALFKSSTIQPLTEKESEYVVSVQKHVFKKHVVLQVGGGAIRLFIFFFLLSIFFFLLQPRAPSSSPSPHTRSSLSKTPSRSSSFAMSPSTSTPPLSKLTARLPPLPSNAIVHACSAAPAPCPPPPAMPPPPPRVALPIITRAAGCRNSQLPYSCLRHTRYLLCCSAVFRRGGAGRQQRCHFAL